MANTLTLEQITEAGPALRQAIYYTVRLWDALRMAELYLLASIDIEPEDLIGLASGCDIADDAMDVSDDDLLAVLQHKGGKS